jgi:hypothetical protein
MDSQPTLIWARIYELTGRETALAQTCRRGAKFSFRVRFILHHCEQLRKIQQIMDFPEHEYKLFLKQYKFWAKYDNFGMTIFGVKWNDTTTIAEYGGQINENMYDRKIRGRVSNCGKCVNYEFYGEITATLHADEYYLCLYCEKYTVGSSLPNCTPCNLPGCLFTLMFPRQYIPNFQI